MPEFLSLGTDYNGVEDLFAFDDGKIVFQRRCADIEPVIERNRRFQNDSNGKFKEGWGQEVASIPFGVVEIWKSQYGVDPTARGNEKLLSRLLNDSDMRGFRTGMGRLDLKER